jgi:hypothetical protein
MASNTGIYMPPLADCWTMPVEELEEHLDRMTAELLELTGNTEETVSDDFGQSAEQSDVPALGPPQTITRLSLQQLLNIDSFWQVLGVEVNADFPEIRTAYKQMARIYHPDKGGSARTMAYLSMILEVLTTRELRAEYMQKGGESFKATFAQAPEIIILAPLVNEGFLKGLMKKQGAHEVTIGKFPLVEYLEAITHNNPKQYAYKECALARSLDVGLRLTGKAPEYPILSLPRIVRNAAFMGTGLVELDLPASHGQQICKYARMHKLPRDVLEAAFGNHDNIKGFRNRAEFQEAGLAPGRVKQACNLLGYGSGCKDFLKEQEMVRLPALLGRLKMEIAAVRRHMVRECPGNWKEALLKRERWELTLLSVHCQLGERRDLALCEENLPLDTPCRGYLGDSISVIPGPTFNSDEFCKRMEQLGIYVTIKAARRLPQAHGSHDERQGLVERSVREGEEASLSTP